MNPILLHRVFLLLMIAFWVPCTSPAQSTQEIMKAIRLNSSPPESGLPSASVVTPGRDKAHPERSPRMQQVPSPGPSKIEGRQRKILGGKMVILVPKGWHVIDYPTEAKLLRPLSGPRDLGHEEIGIRNLGKVPAAPLDCLFPLVLDGMKREMPGMQTSDIERAMIGDLPALKADFAATDMRDRIGQIYVFTHANHLWVVVAFVFSDEDGPIAFEEIQAVSGTIEFVNP